MKPGSSTWLLALSLAVLLLPGCKGDPPADDDDDDDDTTADPGCDDGFIDDGGECVPEPCGVGTWGNLAVGDDTVFVDGAAQDGGDGSQGAPYTSMQQALDAGAEEGLSQVAVAAGSYLENLALGSPHKGMTLAGRCAELVEIDGSERDDVPGIDVDLGFTGGAVAVSGVTVTRCPWIGIFVWSGELTVRQSAVVDNRFIGVIADGSSAHLVLEGVEVRGTLPDASNQWGHGVQVSDRGTLTADGCLLEGNTKYGLLVRNQGSTATVTHCSINDTVRESNGQFGYGVQVGEQGTLTITDSVIEGNESRGVLVAQAGSSVDLERVEIRDTGRGDDEEIIAGFGIDVFGGATLSARDCLLERNLLVGVGVFEPGSTVALEDVEIRDTLSDDAGFFGYGLQVVEGGALEVVGGVVEANQWVGVLADGSGTTLEMQDVEILGTQRGVFTTTGIGLVAQSEAVVTAGGITIGHNEGPGAYVLEGGGFTCADCALDDNAFAGIVLFDGQVALTGGTIADTGVDDSQGGGTGIFASDRRGVSTLEVDGTAIGPQPFAALWLAGNGAYQVTGAVLVGSDGYELGNGMRVHGNAVYASGGVTAWDGQLGLHLLDNTLTDCSVAAVLLDGSEATLQGNSYSGNGLDLLQQRCSDLSPPDVSGESPITELCPTYDELVVPLGFEHYPRDTIVQ